MLGGKKTVPFIILAVLVLFMLGARFVAPPVIEAEAIRLKDKQGRVRASIELSDDGSPSLSLFDAEGHSQARMALSSQGNPSFTMGSGGPANPRFGIVVDPTQGAEVSFRDGLGKPRLALTVTDDGTGAIPHVDFFHDSSRRLSLNLGKDGDPTMSFAGSDGSIRLMLAQKQDGTSIGFGDQQRQARLAIGFDTEPYLMMIGKQKENIVRFKLQDDPVLFSFHEQTKTGNMNLFLSPNGVSAQFNGADGKQVLLGTAAIYGSTLLEIIHKGKMIFKTEENKP